MSLLTTGNEMVDLVGQMNITGNVIPQAWLKNITYDNGKPCTTAIFVLSDIVYWYKPTEIRDEETGKLIGYRKKFKSDMLQRTYKSYAEQFNFSKRQIKEAIDILVNKGIVIREFRTLELKVSTLYNVMFLGLNVEKLWEVTFTMPDDEEDDRNDLSAEDIEDIEDCENEDTENVTPHTSKSKRCIQTYPNRYIQTYHSGVTGCKTNTKNTTKTTYTKTTSSSRNDLEDLKTENHPSDDEEEVKKNWKSDFEKIRERWNRIEGLNKVSNLNPGSHTQRIRLLKARLKDYPLDDFMTALDNIEKSSFLRGENNRGWKITFDWLVNEGNFIKVLEGNYQDTEPKVNDFMAELDAAAEEAQRILDEEGYSY